MIRGIRTLYYYDGATEDPRFVDLTPASSTAPMTK
jgi:hypothetical protein